MTGNNWWAPATSSIAPPCFKVLTREAVGGHGRGSEWSACRPLLWLSGLTSDREEATTPQGPQRLLCRMRTLKWERTSSVPSCPHAQQLWVPFSAPGSSFLKLEICTASFFPFITISSLLSVSALFFCFFFFFHLIEWSTPRMKASNPGLGQTVGRNKATGAVKPSSNWPKKKRSSWCSNRKSSPRSHPDRFCFWDPLFPKRHLASIRKRVCQEHHRGICSACFPRLRRPSFGDSTGKASGGSFTVSLLPGLGRVLPAVAA